MNTSFEWNENKNAENLKKLRVGFENAQYAFIDSKRVIAQDLAHSKVEKRYYCFGKVKGGVLTVRFTYRGNRIRIIGTGYWRKGKNIHEKQNPVQQ